MRGIAICHYNRQSHLREVIQGVKDTAPQDAKIVICDDSSMPGVSDIVSEFKVLLIQGPNLGVAANKNRGLWALQNCATLCLLEDDLVPVNEGWYEIYEAAARRSGIKHFCRVQGKETDGLNAEFDDFMAKKGFTPIYGTSPRGDLTFLTGDVLKVVGGFNPLFRGAGFAHGEWSERVARAGLISHPQKWVDIQEARDSFAQVGDREGGRWDEEAKVHRQIQRNREVLKELNATGYIHSPLVLE